MALIPKGARLYVNARTRRAGSIRIGVQSAPGSTAIDGHTVEECIPTVGDHPRELVRWNGTDNLGVKPGEPVILRLVMEQAELFAIEFAD